MMKKCGGSEQAGPGGREQGPWLPEAWEHPVEVLEAGDAWGLGRCEAWLWQGIAWTWLKGFVIVDQQSCGFSCPVWELKDEATMGKYICLDV